MSKLKRMCTGSEEGRKHFYTWRFMDQEERVISPMFDTLEEADKWLDVWIEHGLLGKPKDERTDT